MGRPLPLTLCTWDYVPNKWFGDRTKDVLDDMARHGVSVFPRTRSVPPAKADEAGKLAFDWTLLNADLDLLRGRGQILFQLTHPPITFVTPPPATRKREIEIDYLRRWRDYLKAKGLDYGDYAFYPVDEPGLDYGLNTVPAFLDAAELFRAADPKFRIYTDPVPSLSRADFERIRPYVDVWCPNMRLVSGLLSGDPRMQWIRESDKPVWSYECVSQVKSLSPLRYNRANAWRGNFFGLAGIGFWTHSTTEIDHWLPGKTINDEYVLVYPGTLPVSPIRLPT
jgi:hypothetical protein